MTGKLCIHMNDSLTDYNEISNFLSFKPEICCTNCDYDGQNLWLCLKKNCGHIGCGEKFNDHSTIHNANNVCHSLHMNLSTRRVWCYECNKEVVLEHNRRRTSFINKEFEKDQESINSAQMMHKDSGHGSCTTLGASSPDNAALFENSVGLNVALHEDDEEGSADSSDVGEFGDYDGSGQTQITGGLVGLQNIGNTCYMNSALQALSNTEPLTQYFIDCANIVHILSDGKKPGLSRTYQSLIRDMWLKKKKTQNYVTPSGILYGIRNVHAMFRGYHQHDTQEFLRNFMDQLHEELKQPVMIASSEILPGDSDTFSLAMEDIQNNAVGLNYDSSEGEYETCDSGVSERSSLSDDSEAQHQIAAVQANTTVAGLGNLSNNKRRLSRCQSPGRRQRPRVGSQNIIDSQPTSVNNNSGNHQIIPKRQIIKYRSIISDIFDGKLLSSVQCLTCNRVSSRVETFQDLSLPIPSKDHLVLLHGRTSSVPNVVTCSDAVVPIIQDGWISWVVAWLRSWWYGPVITLHDCLSAFFSTDELKGDNMYSCEKCSKLRNGIKFSKVLQLPEVLCIHLKRFRHELMYSSKIASPVSFPLNGLDMWPYLHSNNTSKVSKYELFSVICHHGTAGGGHYTSYALNKGQWYEFDDQYVVKVPAERVQHCEAYVLFYRKVQSSAEDIRHRAQNLLEEIDEENDADFNKKVLISRQWISKFYNCVEPGFIDNSDFLCQHGALDPERELVFEHLFIEIPLEMYNFLYKRFGGCPPIMNPVICPACSALRSRILREMQIFLEISRKTQGEHYPHTHYLSTSWYLQWHAFVQKKTAEPPGPIDNSKIDPNNINRDEAANVPQPIWDFFYNIYGGGPIIFIDSESDDDDGDETARRSVIINNNKSENDEMKGNEMGDGPASTTIIAVNDTLCNGNNNDDSKDVLEPEIPSEEFLNLSQIDVEAPTTIDANNSNDKIEEKSKVVNNNTNKHKQTWKKGSRYRRRNH